MSLKSLACMAAAVAITMPAAALPTIEIVDNENGTAALNVIVDGAGSLGAELTLELTGATLTGATINDTLFDTPNPGDNPFIPGSPIGGDTTGLGLDLANNRLFAAFGAGDPGIGTFEFLTFTFDGSGTATAMGLVAQANQLNDGLAAVDIDITQGGSLAADFNGDGTVDLLDLDILGGNFGLTPATMAQGDANGDGTVDLLDLDILGSTFGDSVGSSVSVPEPAAALLSLIALGGVAGFRRR
ncbi:MAG: dockerin type I domain-containing protein [Planctomycetota bacterium]